MNLVVFGATGGTGRCVVEQALRHERLRVVRAYVFQSAEIEP